jgi:hypothetical protein
LIRSSHGIDDDATAAPDVDVAAANLGVDADAGDFGVDAAVGAAVVATLAAYSAGPGMLIVEGAAGRVGALATLIAGLSTRFGAG